MKNKYVSRSRISESKFRTLVRCFSADLTALQTAELTGLNRNTVNRFYRGLRERIYAACEAQRPMFGVVEVDESYFGPRRVKGKRGRGAYGKTAVFGIFERAGQVYTEVVSDCSKATLQGIIRGRVDPASVVNSDGWRGYNGLVDLGYGHYRVDHSKDEFARGRVHINRRQDIHERFGGQQQGGISIPTEHPFVFIFTGKAGEQYGYEDGWKNEGVFLYTGEDQEGDMRFVRGNAAITVHHCQAA